MDRLHRRVRRQPGRLRDPRRTAASPPAHLASPARTRSSAGPPTGRRSSSAAPRRSRRDAGDGAVHGSGRRAATRRSCRSAGRRASPSIPQTGLWAFNRKSWENATWKRYRGGTAPDIWVGDPDQARLSRRHDLRGDRHVPDVARRADLLPQRSGRHDEHLVDAAGRHRRQAPHRLQGLGRALASMGPDGRIVFMLGADIHVFDPADGAERKVEVDLPSDRTLTRVRYPDPRPLADLVRPLAGRRPARGRDPRRDLLGAGEGGRHASGHARQRRARELGRLRSRGEEARLRHGRAARGGDPRDRRLGPRRAEDGRARRRERLAPPAHLLARRQVDRLRGPDPDALRRSGRRRRRRKAVDHSTQAEIREYAWSPDGRWLAYAKAPPHRLHVDLHLRHEGREGPRGDRRHHERPLARPGIPTAATSTS